MSVAVDSSVFISRIDAVQSTGLAANVLVFLNLQKKLKTYFSVWRF
jgi:hypothetical protein